MEWLSRTELLLGETNIDKLQKAHVLVVGLGGVGGYAAEMLCRAGIGTLSLVDGDIVKPSNINRQLIALHSSIENPKASVLANRLRDINPDIQLHIYDEFIKDERMLEILKMHPYDYVVDAIDTLSPKVYLAFHSLSLGLPLVSSMGAGAKMDPEKIQITDISKSNYCRLAFYMRKHLGKLGIRKGFKVVFSPEESMGTIVQTDFEQNKRSNVGTISYMPPLFGCFCASVVIRGLIGDNAE